MSEFLRPTIAEAEGFGATLYLDTATPPKLTFAHGRNLEDQPLTGKEWRELYDAKEIEVRITPAGAQRLLKSGIADCLITCAMTFRWWADLDEVRRDVIAELAYQLGLTRLMRFRQMLVAMERRDYDGAANELLWNSPGVPTPYAIQVPSRANRLANQLCTGVRQ